MTTDLIEVDGKWYDSNLNEVSSSKTPVSYTDTTWNVTFVEGQEYSNFFGTYRVEAILPDRKMMVRYTVSAGKGIVAGEVKTYPIAAQAETIALQQKREEAEVKKLTSKVNAMEFDTARDTATLEYIRQHGKVSVAVPSRYRESFNTKYSHFTGDVAENHMGEGYLVVDNEDWWGLTMRVYLPMNGMENELAIPKEGVVVRDNTMTISSNSFVWGLFKMGFRIGRNSLAVAA